MNRRARFPFLRAALLFVMWLLLNNSLAPGHVLLGILLAAFLADRSRNTPSLRPSVRRLWLSVVLLCVVIADIVRSNITVARFVLGIGKRGGEPGFVKVPLEMRDPGGLAILAMILTATPGTVWVDFDQAEGELTLHILDLQDEAAWIGTVKQRYERPLQEIFE